MKKTNIWDFLISLIPVFATLLGVLVTYILKNIGRIKARLDKDEYTLRSCNDNHYYINAEDTIDVFNSSETYKIIKNMTLYLKTDKKIYMEEYYINLFFNSERISKDLNFYKLAPKELLRIMICGSFIIEDKDELPDSIKLYLEYENSNGKKKRIYLNTIIKNNLLSKS